MKSLTTAVLLGLLGLGTSQCLAATYRVDDRATLPSESTALLRWRQTAPSLQRDDTLEGATALALQLDVSRWMDQEASLYLVFPEQGSAALRASWTSRGRLLSGEVLPGQRVLVYRGRITGPVIEDTLLLSITADGNRLAGIQRLNFHFEIDTE
jgi:hypothetical protein